MNLYAARLDFYGVDLGWVALLGLLLTFYFQERHKVKQLKAIIIAQNEMLQEHQPIDDDD